MSNKKFTFIDLFAGCGGLSEGFLSSNKFKGLAHVEWELPMVNTLRKRLETKWKHTEDEALKHVIHFDIQKTNELLNGSWNIDTKSLYQKTNHNSVINKGLKGIIGNKKVDFIIGGPPCQAYSIAGRAQDKNSMKDDYRNYLFESFVEVVKEFQPKAFVFENVPGMLSAEPGGIKVTERVYKAFNEIGYEITTPKNLKNRVYVADDFQVPQKRRRLIIVGIKKDRNYELNELYKKIDVQKSENKKNVKDALFNLPTISPLKKVTKVKGKNVSHKLNENDVEIMQHEPRHSNERDVRVFKEWVENEMNKKTLNEKIEFYNRLLNKESKHAKYRNLEWDKPSPTVVAHLYKDGLMFIHPDSEQARSITIREAGLLQSFPMDFEFVGSKGYCYKMIGNAVPPLMAKSIAIGINDYFKNISL
ncbi:DNA cytosine methyltransferase [Ulvibacter antarcticus]|uniref:Cytosine-specific methyltransferase n=1 Tax=Ulvibacter antarcticus TaxID=442714 RepID=A0A3L9Z7G7_9FLAO|nr:DNA cytosine methyltransferase [Ulvibacter antarcticus]RMA66378.1 DNA (cytosine-5)-methyltransferase 1 [Ulvibacter antarcticus]